MSYNLKPCQDPVPCPPSPMLVYIIVALVFTFLHFQPKVDLFHCHLSKVSTLSCSKSEKGNTPLKPTSPKKDGLQNEEKDDFIRGIQLSQTDHGEPKCEEIWPNRT